MKHFNWNPEKNEFLKKHRNISFEDIVFYIEKDAILDKLEHPKQEQYKGQQILIIDINNYAYIVPYIETKEEIFLKTIIPSRKMTKKYLGGKKDE